MLIWAASLESAIRDPRVSWTLFTGTQLLTWGLCIVSTRVELFVKKLDRASFLAMTANHHRLSRVVIHATPPLQRRNAYGVLLACLGGTLRMIARELPISVSEYKIQFRGLN